VHILLIEDSSPTRDLLRRSLQESGHRLTTAARVSSGRAAAVAYGVTLTATAIAFNAMWRYAIGRGGRLLRADADRRPPSRSSLTSS